jgi:hypothetical protein
MKIKGKNKFIIIKENFSGLFYIIVIILIFKMKFLHFKRFDTTFMQNQLICYIMYFIKSFMR